MSVKPLVAVRNVFVCQIIAALVAFLGVLIFAKAHCFSFGIGESVIIVANAFLTWNMWRQCNRIQSMRLLMSFFTGELGKYVLIVTLTIVIAKTMTIDWLFYIIGLGVPQLFGAIGYGLK